MLATSDKKTRQTNAFPFSTCKVLLNQVLNKENFTRKSELKDRIQAEIEKRPEVAAKLAELVRLREETTVNGVSVQKRYNNNKMSQRVIDRKIKALNELTSAEEFAKLAKELTHTFDASKPLEQLRSELMVELTKSKSTYIAEEKSLEMSSKNVSEVSESYDKFIAGERKVYKTIYKALVASLTAKLEQRLQPFMDAKRLAVGKDAVKEANRQVKVARSSAEEEFNRGFTQPELLSALVLPDFADRLTGDELARTSTIVSLQKQVKEVMHNSMKIASAGTILSRIFEGVVKAVSFDAIGKRLTLARNGESLDLTSMDLSNPTSGSPYYPLYSGSPVFDKLDDYGMESESHTPISNSIRKVVKSIYQGRISPSYVVAVEHLLMEVQTNVIDSISAFIEYSGNKTKTLTVNSILGGLRSFYAKDGDLFEKIKSELTVTKVKSPRKSAAQPVAESVQQVVESVVPDLTLL